MISESQNPITTSQNNLQFGKWANLSLRLSEQFDPLIESFVDDLLEKERLSKGLTNLTNHKSAFSFLLSNLILIYGLDPSAYCLLKRGTNDYPSNSYNPNRIGSRALRRCFGFLRDNEFIEVRGGNFNRSGQGSPGGSVTRCRAQESLLEALSSPETTEHSIGEEISPGITWYTNLITDTNSINFTNLLKKTNIPIIRMKDENKRYIETPDHDDLNRMTSNLQRINSNLEDHWIDLCIPDEELREALTNRSVEEDGLPGERSSLRTPYNLAMQRSLYRVFNNGTFENGGRFYGGWWQQIKSDYRKFITINWHPVSEVDFSSMQPAMLYALEGLPAPDDAYEIEGIPEAYRDLLKKTFLQIINAADNRVRAPRREELPEGMSFLDVKNALRAKHEPISKYFNSGIGIKIQRIDSYIAETVMLTLMEEDQLVLPVHDSFIIRSGEGNVERLKAVMREASAQHVNQELNLKLDPQWMDELINENDVELHELGVRDISENFSALIHQPEYACYNQRRWDFVNFKGEEWGHNRQWFSG